MKNILAENLLRFGVKNLSDDIKRKLQEQTEGGGAGAQLQNLGLSIDQKNLDLADSEGYLSINAYANAFKLYAGPAGSNLVGKNLYLLKSFEVTPQTKSQQAGADTQRLSPVTGVRAQNISSLPIKSLWTSLTAGSSYAGAVRVYFTTYNTSFSKSQFTTNFEAWKKANPGVNKITGSDVSSIIAGVEFDLPKVPRTGIDLILKPSGEFPADVDSLMRYLRPTNGENSYFVNTIDTMSPQLNQRGENPTQNIRSSFLPVYQYKMSADGKSQAIMGYIPQIWDPQTLEGGQLYGVQVN
jgi:hypothetical protein